MAFFNLKNHNQIDSPNCAALRESVQIIQINPKLFECNCFEKSLSIPLKSRFALGTSN